MLDHAKEALSMVDGRTRADLDCDRQLNLSLVRLLEIIGEAAGRMPGEFRDSQPGVPWPEIICLRNRLIHGYDQVDFDVLWEIVTKDLPNLATELERILNSEGECEDGQTR